MHFQNIKQEPPRFILPPLNGTLHTQTPLLSFNQQPQQTFSYSPYLEHSTHAEDCYYPIYETHKQVWPEAGEGHKLKKKKDLDERMKRINQEFLDNKKSIYEEKLKQLQQELSAVEKGIFFATETYNESMADLEEKRRKTIDEARLMMKYQIACVDKEFQLQSNMLHEESLAEKRELQNTMFMILEEKRKKLKQDKEGEDDFSIHETRHRKRLLRKRGDVLLEQPTKRKQQDRMREIPNHLINALNHRVKEDIDADYHAIITKKLKRST